MSSPPPSPIHTILITGTSPGGIGFWAAATLAAAGHRVIVTCRTAEKAEQCITEIRAVHPQQTLNLDYYALDLNDFSNIERVANAIISSGVPLSCLINNAGASTRLPDREGVNGLWINNYLGHYYLTRLLLPALQQSSLSNGFPSRIIHVSSSFHRFGLTSVGLSDKDPAKTDMDTYVSYKTSKLAQVLFSFELQRRYSTSPAGRVISFALNPGAVDTGIWKRSRFNWVTGPLRRFMFLSSKDGAATIIFAFTKPIQLDQQPVLEYISPYPTSNYSWLRTVKDVWVPGFWSVPTQAEPHPLAKDEELAKKLWAHSEAQINSLTHRTVFLPEQKT